MNQLLDNDRKGYIIYGAVALSITYYGTLYQLRYLGGFSTNVIRYMMVKAVNPFGYLSMASNITSIIYLSLYDKHLCMLTFTLITEYWYKRELNVRFLIFFFLMMNIKLLHTAILSICKIIIICSSKIQCYYLIIILEYISVFVQIYLRVFIYPCYH